MTMTRYSIEYRAYVEFDIDPRLTERMREKVIARIDKVIARVTGDCQVLQDTGGPAWSPSVTFIGTSLAETEAAALFFLKCLDRICGVIVSEV